MVLALAFLSYVGANQVFNNYSLFQDKGMSEDALEDTKYFHSDCGKVILVDRTESYQTSSKSSYDIDYYVTYYSPFRGENYTLNVTPSAFVSAKRYKENGTGICFTVTDNEFHSDSMAYVFFYGLMIVAAFFFCFQTYFWTREEFDI